MRDAWGESVIRVTLVEKKKKDTITVSRERCEKRNESEERRRTKKRDRKIYIYKQKGKRKIKSWKNNEEERWFHGLNARGSMKEDCEKRRKGKKKMEATES